MFNLGFTEILFLAILALIVVGPKQLPEVARYIGRFLSELKRSSEAMKEEFRKTTFDVKEDFERERDRLQQLSQKIESEIEKINQENMKALQSPAQKNPTDDDKKTGQS